MTRTTDTLIALGDRGGFCTAACDLFVSLHVNSLARRRGYTEVRGFETFFLAEARTEDAARVAKMENEAVRFETGESEGPMTGGLDFILKDLQLNEHLRESARAAELVQKKLRTVHTGDDRGVKQAGFMVLTTARRPAILVEMGYSTNPAGRPLSHLAPQPAHDGRRDRRRDRGVSAGLRAEDRRGRTRGAAGEHHSRALGPRGRPCCSAAACTTTACTTPSASPAPPARRSAMAAPSRRTISGVRSSPGRRRWSPGIPTASTWTRRWC